MSPRSVDVFGWFSFAGSHATIGDLLALSALTEELEHRDVPHRVHYTVPDQLDPASVKVWVCGPVDRSYAPHRALIGSGQGWIMAGTTLITDRSDLGEADVRGARDGAGVETKADLACLAPSAAGGFAALLLRGRQPEYRQDPSDHLALAGVVRGAVVGLGLLPVDLTTAVPAGLAAISAAAGLERVLGSATVVISSRLHGVIHSLRAGVVPVVIDEVAEGGKVEAMALRWGLPVYLPRASCTPEALSLAIEHSRSLPSSEAQAILERMQASAAETVRTVADRVMEERMR